MQKAGQPFQTIIDRGLGSGTGQTDAAVVAEGDTWHHRQSHLVEQAVAQGHRIEAVMAHIREGIEGTLRRLQLQPGDRAHSVAQALTTAVELRGHGQDAVAWPAHGSEGAVLGKGAHVAGALALQCRRGADHALVAGQPADAPAGHGPALGAAAHDYDALGQVGGHRRQAVVAVAGCQQKLVDLVTDHQQLGVAA
jgi:hypothetical protein